MQLELKQVSVKYPQSQIILDKIDLGIQKGEFIGIVGKAGCGKTTLIETIGGLHKPDNGCVLFEGQDIYGKQFDRLSFRRKLQVVFQFPENQFFETDVQSEISFGLKMLKTPSNMIEQYVHEILQDVGLTDRAIVNMSPFALSGGQKRRLALACALVIQPEILLLDEPFSGLDAEGAQTLISTLRNAHKKGMTILMVSHDPNTLCEISDRILVLDNGKISMDGRPVEVYQNKTFCDQTGIGQPETKKLADLLGIDLSSDLSYASLLQKLEQKYKGSDI